MCGYCCGGCYAETGGAASSWAGTTLGGARGGRTSHLRGPDARAWAAFMQFPSRAYLQQCSTSRCLQAKHGLTRPDSHVGKMAQFPNLRRPKLHGQKRRKR